MVYKTTDPTLNFGTRRHSGIREFPSGKGAEIEDVQIPEICDRQGCLSFRQSLHSSAPQAGHGPGVAGNRAPGRQRCGQAAFLRSDERRGQEAPSGHFIVVSHFLRGRKF